jgi:hypothetical protein
MEFAGITPTIGDVKSPVPGDGRRMDKRKV